MNGPEHYRTAEALLEVIAARMAAGKHLARGDMDSTTALAQVHATLALAAASAQNIRRNGALEGGTDEWAETLRGAK